MENGVLSHIFEELYHTFLGEVASVQDAGLVEKLLLHVEVVAPVTRLHEGAMVFETGLDEAPQGPQYYQEEEDGPANCLDRARRVSYTKPTKAVSHLVQ